MVQRHISHKQIRRTIKKDELRELLDFVTHFAKTNTENLLISVIIIGVIIVLVPMYFRHQAENEMRSANILDRALSYSMQPVNPAGAMVGQNFKNLEEKYKKCLEAYGEITGTYRNTHAANVARLGEAQALFNLKEYAKAEGIFQEELEKHAQDYLTPELKVSVAACLENLEKWQEALVHYQEVLNEYPKCYDRRGVRLAVARCLLQLGKTDEAKKLLKEEQALEPGSFGPKRPAGSWQSRKRPASRNSHLTGNGM